MKKIIYIILALVPSLGTCQEYRFFELLVSDEAMSYDEREDPARLLAGIDDEGVILKSYAVVRNDSSKPLVLDRAYYVQFPEVIGSSVVDYSETDRKVGLEIAVTEKADKKVKLVYKQSDIEKWISIGGVRGVVVPMFGMFNLEGDLDFSKTDLVVRGGLQRDSTHRILVIQRVAEPGESGNGVKLRRTNGSPGRRPGS